MWDQLEPTAPHLAYLTISIFLIIYALFSIFIRNNLHLSGEKAFIAENCGKAN